MEYSTLLVEYSTLSKSGVQCPKNSLSIVLQILKFKKKYVIHAVMHVSHIYIKTYQQNLDLDLVRYLYQLLYK